MRQECKTDFAFLNGGSFRADQTFPKGDITLATIHGIFPFEDVVVTLQLTGAEVYATLNNGVSMLPGAGGRFLQVSGLKFSYNINAPRNNRVVAVFVGDKPLDKNALYSVAVNGYIASGKDGFDCLTKVKVLKDAESSPLLQHVIKHALTLTPVISPKVEGRIVCLDK